MAGLRGEREREKEKKREKREKKWGLKVYFLFSIGPRTCLFIYRNIYIISTIVFDKNVNDGSIR